MHDAMVAPDDEQVVTLIIENHGLQPLKLEKGHVLGHVLPAMEAEFHKPEDGALPMVALTEHNPERNQALLDAVSINDDELTEAEHEMLSPIPSTLVTTPQFDNTLIVLHMLA